MKIINGTIKRNAKSAVLTSVYPKVVFNSEKLDETVVLFGPIDGFRIPVGEKYFIAEPEHIGWGDIADGMRCREGNGTYYFSYAYLTSPPTTTTAPTTTVPTTTSPTTTVPSTTVPNTTVTTTVPTTTSAPTTTVPTTTVNTGCVIEPITFIPHVTQTGSVLNYRWRYNGNLAPADTFSFHTLTVDYPHRFRPFWWYSGPIAVNNGNEFVGGGYEIWSYKKDGNKNWFRNYLDQHDTQSPFPEGYLPIMSESKIIFAMKMKDYPKFDANGNAYNFGRVDPDTGVLTLIPSGYSDTNVQSLVENSADEIVMCPDGKTFLALGEYNGTFTFRLEDDGTVSYVGQLTGHGFEDEGEGMSSSLRFQHIPGTNEMYYSGYNYIARIDCTTNTVVWYVQNLSSYDEIFVIHPNNKNLIKQVVNDSAGWLPGTPEDEIDSTLSLAEYSYVDGSLVRIHRIGGLRKGIKTTYTDYYGNVTDVRGYSQSLNQMTLARDCNIYFATDNGAVGTYSLLGNMTTDLHYLDPNYPDGQEIGQGPYGPPYPFPIYSEQFVEYYTTHILTADNVWWGIYAHRPNADVRVTTLGFFAYDGTTVKTYLPNVVDYPESRIYDMTTGFSIVGNEIYYGSNYGISKLVIGDDTPPLMFRTNVGSSYDYKFVYRGPTFPQDDHTTELVANDGWFSTYNAPVPISEGTRFIMGNDIRSYNIDGSTEFNIEDDDALYQNYSTIPGGYTLIDQDGVVYQNDDGIGMLDTEGNPVYFKSWASIYSSIPGSEGGVTPNTGSPVGIIMAPDKKSFYSFSHASLAANKLVSTRFDKFTGNVIRHIITEGDFQFTPSGLTHNYLFKHDYGYDRMYYVNSDRMAAINCKNDTILWSTVLPSADNGGHFLFSFQYNALIITNLASRSIYTVDTETGAMGSTLFSLANDPAFDGEQIRNITIHDDEWRPKKTMIYLATDIRIIALELTSWGELSIQHIYNLPEGHTIPYFGYHMIDTHGRWYQYYNYYENAERKGGGFVMYKYDSTTPEAKIIPLWNELSPFDRRTSEDGELGFSMVGDDIYYLSTGELRKLSFQPLTPSS